MKAIARRLRRLEARLRPPVESWEMRRLLERLETARRRCGLLPPSPERLAELRNRSVAEILVAGRQRNRMKLTQPSYGRQTRAGGTDEKVIAPAGAD